MKPGASDNSGTSGSPSTPPPTPVRVLPQTRAFAEAYAASMALVNQGGDLAGGAGLDRAVAVARQSANQLGYGVFTVLSGGRVRHDGGVQARLTASSLMAGFSRAASVLSGRLVLGLFAEAGFARYTTDTSTVRGPVDARGRTRYVGGGVLAHYLHGASRKAVAASGTAAPGTAEWLVETARHNREAERLGGFHAEASIRAGSMDMDFSSPEMRDVRGRSASYKARAPYIGGHVGVGYLLNVGEKTDLDLYTKVFATRMGGDNVSVLGDPVFLDNSNSLRWRTGARLSHALNDNAVLYAGAAYEREFAGSMRATTYGMPINAPSFRGDSGVFEAGVQLASENGLSADIAVEAAVGQRKGLGGRRCSTLFRAFQL